MKRIASIDVTRGIVIIIMALDHTRDLLHTTSLTQQPTSLDTTTPILFFTRFITHLCAPTFVFLAGVSAYLSCQKQDNAAKNRRSLLTRGFVLMITEFTFVNVGMFFDLQFRIVLFEVIAAIGLGFIVLGLFMHFPLKIIGLLGLLICCFHDLASLIPFSGNSGLKKIAMALFVPVAFPFGQSRLFLVVYSPIPWLGILMMGFSLGRLFLLPEVQKRKYFIILGMGLTGLFLLLRLVNKYGDFPWVQQKTGVLTFLSFLNITKYPPSLEFSALMLGCMFMILYAVEGVKNRFTDIVSVCGKTPLFYFIVHWYILHVLLFVIIFIQGYRWPDFVFGFNFGRPKGPSGVNLAGVYVLWIFIVVLMYPLCKWYGRYKADNKRYKWLRYF